MVEVKQLAAYAGPNIYASEPVVVASLRITPDEIAAAPRRIPLVQTACASWFAWTGEAPKDAVDVGRFLIDWARAVQNEFGATLDFGSVCPVDGETRLVLECETPEVTFRALLLSANIFSDIEKLGAAEVDKLLQDFWTLLKQRHPDWQAQFLVNYARKHGIPCRRFVANTLLWQYGWGARSEVFLETSPMEDSATGRTWCRNKIASRELFASIGAPVAPGAQVRNENELAAAGAQVGFPCLTKPADRGRSLGVTPHIKDWDTLVQGYRAATQHSRAPVLVEKYIEGDVHRIFVIRGKFWCAIRRARPFVIGDGKSTILALTEALNAEGAKKLRPGSLWKPLPIDEAFHAGLRELNLKPDYVPPRGARILVGDIARISEGALVSDVTALAHPDVRVMSESIASLFGVKVCGLDYISKDISKSCFEQGAFLEINTTPGVRIPFLGGISADAISRAILGDKPERIPLVLIIAPASRHEQIQPQLPRDPHVGWICGHRSGIGAMEFPGGQSSFNQHLDRIIRNKAVEAVVAVCEMDNIAAQGMPAKRAQLTVFIDAAAAHQPAWTKVLREHSERTVETCSVEGLSGIVSSTLAVA